MTQTIDSIKIDEELLRVAPWFEGPGDFLGSKVAELLRLDEFWGPFFGVREDDKVGFIEDYMREDFDARSFPAIRIYNRTYQKQFDSWFIDGDLLLDVIWPAQIRRRETQRLPDVVCDALLQQFRRPPFFRQMKEFVPGLNELGKRFSVDKSLGFDWQDTILPLTQTVVNFRIDLRIWDDHLEQTDRTKDQPFKTSIGDLKRIVSAITAIRDGTEDVKEVTVTVDQDVSDP